MMLICLAVITFAVWTVAGVCSIIADVQRRKDDDRPTAEQLTAAKKALKLAASGHCCLICKRDCIGGDVAACSAFEWDGTCGGDG